jgi:hypothetical protein
MLNLSDTYLTADHSKSVALYLTADDRAFLVHRHRTPGRCFLHSAVLGHALRTLHSGGTNKLVMHLELRPRIPALSLRLPFIAFVGVGENVAFIYAPAPLTEAEAEPFFDTFADLPLLVSDSDEFFVSDPVRQRLPQRLHRETLRF